MKTHSAPFSWIRLVVLPVLAALAVSSVSCVTTYDAMGRPVQTVDPAVAVAGVAAAGLIGYAVGQDNARGYCGGYGYAYRPYYGPYCY